MEEKNSERKVYLQQYHKKRKERLGIKKISLVLTKDEYDIISGYAKKSGSKSKSLAPFIKAQVLKGNGESTESKLIEFFEKEKVQNLKELLRLVKNCTNNINQIAYSLNLDRYYQQNSITRTKEQELSILKDIYSKISTMENLIIHDYYEIK